MNNNKIMFFFYIKKTRKHFNLSEVFENKYIKILLNKNKLNTIIMTKNIFFLIKKQKKKNNNFAKFKNSNNE